MKDTTIVNPLAEFEANLAREFAEVAKDPQAYVEANHPPAVGNPITLGELVPNAATWANKQIKRATDAGADWLAGSLAPKAVPSKAALAANDKRIDKLNQSIKDKKWEGAMAKVDEDERLVTIQAGGAEAFTKGLEKRAAKITRVITDLQPRVLALKKTLDAMPEKTDAEREAKMIAAKRGMQAIGKARR